MKPPMGADERRSAKADDCDCCGERALLRGLAIILYEKGEGGFLETAGLIRLCPKCVRSVEQIEWNEVLIETLEKNR